MRKFMADFETTTFEGQETTEVWAAALIDLDAACHPDNVTVFNNIEDFFETLFEIDENVNCYFHNLKFDGNFCLNKIIKEYKLYTDDNGNMLMFDQKMPRDGYYTYMVSDFGVWYSITISKNGHYYTLRDSIKLIPFTVEEIGVAFDVPEEYRKSIIDYKQHKHANEYITPEEEHYIKNDVLVMHFALNKMFEKGFTRNTIGSCCMEEFKKLFTDEFNKVTYAKYFQDFTKWESRVEGFESVDDYIRKSYHGGWCIVAPGKDNKTYKNGCTLDVNSLYPSMLHSMSGNRFPVGRPTFFKDEIPDEAKRDDRFYFVRFRCAFDIKPGMLATIQIKGDPLYPSNEWLKTSKVKGKSFMINIKGELEMIRPELVMTQTDFELMKEHYDVKYLEILDGCFFKAEAGIFDSYIDKYMDMKMSATNKVERTLAKLMLNNLTGKLGANMTADFKQFDLKDGLHTEEYHTSYKKAGTISIAAAITSYARRFTITAAQLNYKHFIYADTDSLHLDCTPDKVKGVVIDDKELCCWKCESQWDVARFLRQKCYTEHVTAENLKSVTPYYDIKCAGLGKQGKAYLNRILTDGTISFDSFASGLVIKENLRSVTINGGIVLEESNFIL